MSTSKRTTAFALLSVAVATGLVLASCSSKAENAQAEASGDEVLTGAGISGTTISLGVVTDLTGPFSPLASRQIIGQEQYWAEKKAAGGVCSTYDVELVVRDHAFNVQQAVTTYQEITPEVLAYQDFAGAAHVMAVTADLEADSRVLLSGGSTRQLAQSPLVLVPAAFIGEDMRTVATWLVETGKIDQGETVVVVQQEGDYGDEAYSGAEAAAEENDLTLLRYQIKPTDTDLTAVINDGLGKGATAVLLATSPAQTASVATVLQGAGVELPIGGVYTTFAPTLLDTPAADYLTSNYYLPSYVTTFETDAGAELYERLTEANPGEGITSDTTMGYTAAMLLDTLLEAACAAGDLTPEGLAAQRLELGTVQFDGLKVDMDYSTVGASPATGAFIVKPDPTVDGSLSTVDGPFAAGE